MRILALGDSLTAGFGLPHGQSFTEQLEKALAADGLDVEIINAGVSGDTTAGGLARLEWALASDPRAVIVCLGANDALRGLRPGLARNNLDAILSRLKEKGLDVLLAGMKAPPNMGRNYVEAFDGIYPRLAEKHGVALYPFFLEGVVAVPALNQADGIHPNARGVAVVVERILPHVKQLITDIE